MKYVDVMIYSGSVCIAPLAQCFSPYTCKYKKILTWLPSCYFTMFRNLMLNKSCLFIQDLNYMWAIHIFLHFIKHVYEIIVCGLYGTHSSFLSVEVFTVVYQGFWSAWTWHYAWLDGWFPVFWRKILLSYSRV